MKRITAIAFTIVTLLFISLQPVYADRGGHGWHGGHGGHFRFGITIGPGWGPGWWPYYPYYPYYPPPTVVVPQQPDVYVQPPRSDDSEYWYYCQNPEGYYPYVKQCPRGWMKVVPSPPPGEEEK